MAIIVGDKIEHSLGNGNTVVNAKNVAGHKSVSNLSELYLLTDNMLSATGTNYGSDAIGQKWYVISEEKEYQLISWENRNNSSGWIEITGGGSVTIPIATEENNGLMSTEQVKTLNKNNEAIGDIENITTFVEEKISEVSNLEWIDVKNF